MSNKNAQVTPKRKQGTPRPRPEGSAFYSINDAAAYLHVSRTTIYSLIDDRKLPLRKLGRRSFIREDDIKAFVDALPVANAETL